jgi:hypothetical protein
MQHEGEKVYFHPRYLVRGRINLTPLCTGKAKVWPPTDTDIKSQINQWELPLGTEQSAWSTPRAFLNSGEKWKHGVNTY